jgi:hypothetical protein
MPPGVRVVCPPGAFSPPRCNEVNVNDAEARDRIAAARPLVIPHDHSTRTPTPSLPGDGRAAEPCTPAETPQTSFAPGAWYHGRMSADPPEYRPTPLPTARTKLAHERERITRQLRDLADQLDAVAVEDLSEPMVRLSALVEALVKAAELVLKRTAAE